MKALLCLFPVFKSPHKYQKKNSKSKNDPFLMWLAVNINSNKTTI